MTAGELLRGRLAGALPEDSEWDEREASIVDLAVAQADDIEELEDLLVRQGLTVTGSMGQKRLNPLVTELRLQRASLGRLLAQLRLPDEAGGVVKDPKKQRAAQAMHQQRMARKGGQRLRVVGGQ